MRALITLLLLVVGFACASAPDSPKLPTLPLTVENNNFSDAVVYDANLGMRLGTCISQQKCRYTLRNPSISTARNLGRFRIAFRLMGTTEGYVLEGPVLETSWYLVIENAPQFSRLYPDMQATEP